MKIWLRGLLMGSVVLTIAWCIGMKLTVFWILAFFWSEATISLWQTRGLSLRAATHRAIGTGGCMTVVYWFHAFYPHYCPWLKYLEHGMGHLPGFSWVERWIVKAHGIIVGRIGENRLARTLLYVVLIVVALIAAPASIFAGRFFDMNKWVILAVALIGSTLRNLLWAAFLSRYSVGKQAIACTIFLAMAILIALYPSAKQKLMTLFLTKRYAD